MGSIVMQRLQAARQVLAKAGPYVLIEILLPGGTLIALALFLYQRATGAADGGPQVTVVLAWALGKLRGAMARLPRLVDAGRAAAQERDGLEPLAMSPLH